MPRTSTFDLPITQVELADAIGTSTVHVNRVLQALRANGLIQTKGTQVTIPDWEKLKEVGGFDPLYLHLEKEERSMSLTFQPVRVNTGFEEEGVLVFDEQQRLVAVLVRLSDQNEVAPGQWYLEAGFGPLDGISHPAFADLDGHRTGSASASPVRFGRSSAVPEQALSCEIGGGKSVVDPHVQADRLRADFLHAPPPSRTASLGNLSRSGPR